MSEGGREMGGMVWANKCVLMERSEQLYLVPAVVGWSVMMRWRGFLY